MPHRRRLTRAFAAFALSAALASSAAAKPLTPQRFDLLSWFGKALSWVSTWVKTEVAGPEGPCGASECSQAGWSTDPDG